MTVLTEKETDFLKLLRDNNNPDEYNCTETSSWFTVGCLCDHYGLDVKSVRGLVSSLMKKEIIIHADTDNGVKHFEYDFESHVDQESEKAPVGKAAKAITAKDPRKKFIMAEFKKVFECIKVTTVKESKTHYSANCLVMSDDGRYYDSLGQRMISKEDVPYLKKCDQCGDSRPLCELGWTSLETRCDECAAKERS